MATHSYGAAFAPDGRLATTSLHGKVRLYNRTFDLVATMQTTGVLWPFGIAFHPSGATLAIGYSDTTHGSPPRWTHARAAAPAGYQRHQQRRSFADRLVSGWCDPVRQRTLSSCSDFPSHSVGCSRSRCPTRAASQYQYHHDPCAAGGRRAAGRGGRSFPCGPRPHGRRAVGSTGRRRPTFAASIMYSPCRSTGRRLTSATSIGQGASAVRPGASHAHVDPATRRAYRAADAGWRAGQRMGRH